MKKREENKTTEKKSKFDNKMICKRTRMEARLSLCVSALNIEQKKRVQFYACEDDRTPPFHWLRYFNGEFVFKSSTKSFLVLLSG